MSRKAICLVLALSALVPVAGLLAARAFHGGPPAAEYPDAPFAKVEPSYPRIIPVREAPSDQDKDALAQHRAERLAIHMYLVENGAVSRATAEEREAVKAVLDRHYIRGQELAGKILAESPQSVAALFTLATAQFRGEGNLPLALHYVRAARYLLHRRGQADPHDGDSREWYLLILDLEYDIVRALDRNDEAIRVVELLEQIYEPMPWAKIWPLMKLERYEEAETCIRASERDGRWRRHVLNCRMVIEEQRRRRAATYAAGRVMVQELKDSAVLWNNHGLGCINDFRFDEAEKALLQGARLPIDFHGTPYQPLISLYLQQGRFPEALDAFKKGQNQRAQRRAYTLQQDQGRTDRTQALLLLALGNAREAERLARKARQEADRLGSNSAKETDDAIANLVLLWTTLQARQQQLEEIGAAVTERQLLEFEAWTVRQQVLKLLAGPTRIHAMRPNLPNSPGIEPWLLGSLVRIHPTGVATETIRQARQQEDHAAAGPYFDALEAEAALVGGDPERALVLARQALATLPATAEKLLHCRTAAVAAEAARQLGQTEEGLRLLDGVLRDFPQVCRLLEIAIPVRIEDDGSPLARRCADRLARSPRFRRDPNGFLITVRTAGDRLSFQMFRLGQARHLDGDVPILGTEDQMLTAALTRFYEQLMAPLADLGQLDSLDGSLSAIRMQGDIDKMLEPVRPR